MRLTFYRNIESIKDRFIVFTVTWAHPHRGDATYNSSTTTQLRKLDPSPQVHGQHEDLTTRSENDRTPTTTLPEEDPQFYQAPSTGQPPFPNNTIKPDNTGPSSNRDKSPSFWVSRPTANIHRSQFDWTPLLHYAKTLISHKSDTLGLQFNHPNNIPE